MIFGYQNYLSDDVQVVVQGIAYFHKVDKELITSVLAQPHVGVYSLLYWSVDLLRIK